MTKATTVAEFVKQGGKVKQFSRRGALITKRKSTAARLAEVLETNECPACGTGLDRITNRHGGHLSLCNSPACPVRLAFPATETAKERYYYISSTEEFDFTKV